MADRPTPGPGIQTARVVTNLGTTEIAITGWQAFPQQTFANTKSHIIRTGTTNTPLLPQTALSYGTAAPYGGRLEPKTPQEREKSVIFAAPESPDDLSDSGGGIRKRTRTLG